MVAKKNGSTEALVTIIGALDTLGDTDRQWVLQSAASKFAFTIPAGGTGAQVNPGVFGSAASQIAGVGVTADVQAAIAKKDPRAFIRIKKPDTDVQRVACLGYYVVHTTGQQGFSSKDLSKAHTDSGGSAMNLTRALDNATRRAKYLSNRGPREKQLTTLGEDVVNALPDQTAVAAVEVAATRRGGKKGKRGKKAKKA